MGMTGNYIALADAQIKQIADGNLELGELNTEDYASLDIDKSWQAIHYLLTGDICEGAAPFGYVVPMQDDNAVDYGEFGAFYLYREQVAEASAALAQLSKNDVLARYNFDDMVEESIYPVMDDEDKDEFFDYLYVNLQAIQAYYEKAAADGNGVVFYIF
ncbi:DUF1877 family protein [Paenibacillaceae bacterium]|nr:DUF1877 family protein [Paenibacillaceae bacterium]